MDNSLSFEKAYKRLEDILEKLNSEHISLEDSLKIYEEADRLITLCQEKLSSAEAKVQILIKTRNNELALQENLEPSLEDFNPSKEQYLNRTLPK
jgi:exodeoxyribonuclease VII small subunit